MREGTFIKKHRLSILLGLVLLILSAASLFVGVINVEPGKLLAGDLETVEIFLISRLPRLLVQRDKFFEKLGQHT